MAHDRTDSLLAHHFDTMEQQELAITLGMWLFLVTEVMFFGALFAAYAIYRYQYPEIFLEMSHHMNLPLGTVNTLILLTSSYTMVLAVHFAKGGRKTALMLSLIVTILLALAFLGVKGVEYYEKYEHGLMIGRLFHQSGPLSERLHLVMCLYFFMTGLHALHVTIGIGVIGWLVWLTARGKLGGARYMPVEMTGLYWHFVDLVWVFLFPLFYLVGTI